MLLMVRGTVVVLVSVVGLLLRGMLPPAGFDMLASAASTNARPSNTAQCFSPPPIRMRRTAIRPSTEAKMNTPQVVREGTAVGTGAYTRLALQAHLLCMGRTCGEGE